jgi:hypothetical protein
MIYVYRAYGDDGRLLYVGQTGCIDQRMKHHVRAGSPWLDQLASITLERHYGYFAANAAEREAIKSEWPLYNIQCSIEDPHPPHLRAKYMPLRELQLSDPERLQERKRRVEQALAVLLLRSGRTPSEAA